MSSRPKLERSAVFAVMMLGGRGWGVRVSHGLRGRRYVKGGSSPGGRGQCPRFPRHATGGGTSRVVLHREDAASVRVSHGLRGWRYVKGGSPPGGRGQGSACPG